MYNRFVIQTIAVLGTRTPRICQLGFATILCDCAGVFITPWVSTRHINDADL